jgi:predicted metalloendopeptidase
MKKNNKKNKYEFIKKIVLKHIGYTGRFFQSCMDQETITALGAKPLEPWLARVDDIVDKATLAASLVQMAVSDMNVFWSW